MLRLVIAIAIIVLRPLTAWADPAEDAANAAKTAISQIQHDGVPGSIAVLIGLGLVTLLVFAGLVIRALYNANVALQNKRAEEAGRVSDAAITTATKTEASISKMQEDMREIARTQQGMQTSIGTITVAMTNMATQMTRNEDRLDRARSAS
jgi:hypothetical protein